METVYIIGILAVAIVVITTAVLYVGRLRSGRLNINKKGMQMRLEAQPDGRNDTSPERQRGKTVLDDDTFVKSDVDIPENADLKVRGSKFFGSNITVRDRKSEPQDDR